MALGPVEGGGRLTGLRLSEDGTVGRPGADPVAEMDPPPLPPLAVEDEAGVDVDIAEPRLNSYLPVFCLFMVQKGRIIG